MSKEFWAEFESLLVDPKKTQLEYRLHYNDVGEIYLCTMQDHPESTAYVVATKEEYEQYFNYTVVKGQLKKVDRTSVYRVQLHKSTSGYPTVSGHASLIIEPDEEYNNIEYYERNN
jgi:hypothetical protein